MRSDIRKERNAAHENKNKAIIDFFDDHGGAHRADLHLYPRLSTYQERVFSETYGITEQIDLMAGASIRLFNHLTESIQKEIEKQIRREPEVFDDLSYLDQLNQKLEENYSFLMVRRTGSCFSAATRRPAAKLQPEISDYETLGDMESWGNYLDGETEHLIKQREFTLEDGSQMGVYLITNVVDVIPEVRSMILEMFLSSAIILFITGGALTAWVYRSILWPIGRLQEATSRSGRKSGFYPGCGG